MKNPELKPCPFCGKLGSIKTYVCKRILPNTALFTVECENCKASVPWEYFIENAIKNWNMRTTDITDDEPLKLCPFCKHEAKFFLNCKPEEKVMFMVGCLLCGAKTPHYSKIEEAKNAWNRRVTDGRENGDT